MAQTTTYSNRTDKFREKLQYLKLAADPLFLIEDLGFTITNKTRHEVRASCVVHGGDNTTAFRFNRDTRTWVCFTGKCHEVFGNDLIGLIKAVRGFDFLQAVDYLNNLVGGTEGFEDKLAIHERKKENEGLVKISGVENRPDIVNEDALEQHKHFRSKLFINAGFFQSTLDHFEIAGGYVDKEGYNRDIIPIRDLDGALAAFSFRDVRENVEFDKKYILTYGFEKDDVLYNMNNLVASELYKKMPIIIVEGFKSVWRMYEYGIGNVVAVIGSSLTTGQLRLLSTYAIKGCVLFFDNDLPGVEGAMNAYKLLNESKVKNDVVFITEVDENGVGLDPSDLSVEQTYDYLEGCV